MNQNENSFKRNTLTSQKECSGIVFNIQKFCIHDGPGIRTTVFFKGCPLRCSWCANPESQKNKPQILFDRSLCISCGQCVQNCPVHAIKLDEETAFPKRDENLCAHCGQCIHDCPKQAWSLKGEKMNAEKIVKKCLEDRDFYQESHGGVTFSGGEAMMQPQLLMECCKRLQDEDVHTAVETTGCVDPQIFQNACKYLDLLLFDVKHYSSSRHRQGTGAGNEQILENLKWAVSHGYEVLCRIPVIPGFNDSLEDASEFASLFKKLSINQVQLLCFHQMGEKKYEMLDQNYDYAKVRVLYPEDLQEYMKVFHDQGIHAFI